MLQDYQITDILSRNWLEAHYQLSNSNSGCGLTSAGQSQLCMRHEKRCSLSPHLLPCAKGITITSRVDNKRYVYTYLLQVFTETLRMRARCGISIVLLVNIYTLHFWIRYHFPTWKSRCRVNQISLSLSSIILKRFHCGKGFNNKGTFDCESFQDLLFFTLFRLTQ